MSVGTATNVSAAKPAAGGAIYAGEATVTLPTSTSDDIPLGMASLGYISEDGLKHNNSPSNEQIKAWGGDVVMTPTTERPDSFKLTLIEVLNINVLKQVFGPNNVEGTLSDGISIKANSKDLPEQSFVIDMIMRNSAAKRVTIPRGKVTAVSEVTYKDSSAVGYEITITAMADANGNTHYEYIKAAAAV